jgi:hypothetical protein
MLETSGELARLQSLIEESAQTAGPFLRETFEMPDRTPTAAAIVEYLQGVVDLAMATVTSRGEPRVAPVTALFVHGRFYVPTDRASTRVQQLKANPAISVTHWVSNACAFIVHGRAAILSIDHPHFAELDALHKALWWEPLRRQRRGLYVEIVPKRMFAWSGPDWKTRK